ncbi:MAG: heme exporter protein CcmB [Ignavibacteria bacterium]|nr:heme exporter protein CcmB [Ignavibacteria bacterium]
MNAFFQNTVEIFKKELKSEFRTKYVLNSLLMFVLICVSVIRFAAGDEKIDNEILTGLFWVTIFFASVSSLARTFIKEQDKETSIALKLTSVVDSVYSGKLIFNLILSYVTGLISLILFVLIMNYEIKNFPGFMLFFFLGNTGLVIILTSIASIVSKANNKGTLYPVLAFPVLIPLLVSIIHATKLTAEGAETFSLYEEVIIILCYIIVVLTASLMLFKFIWED